MRFAHTRRRPLRHPLATTERGRREGGYVLTQFALLLVPLLLMAGLSIDVGYWYSRASDIQKAADAAALAGVVWLPDVPRARLEARKEAARNGFPDSHADITVSADPVPGTTRRIKVTITHEEISSFFWSNLGGRNLEMSRSATAEYVLPVPLGSPDNLFGNDPTLPANATQMNLWANIHGPRTDTISGDAYATKCKNSQRCSTIQNEGYRTTGYLYAIDVPANVTDMQVQVFDAGVFPRTSQNLETGDVNYQNDGSSTATNASVWNPLDKTDTRWTFYDKDNTEADVADNPVATSAVCNGSRAQPWTPSTTRATWLIPESINTSNPFRQQWQTICRRTGTVPQGRYLLRVQSEGNGASANRYSVRVTAASTTKPRISGYGDMSMYNNVNAGTANFYLAEVGPEHRGKTLEVRLYDPGEVNGDAHMAVIHPNGSVATSCKGDHEGGTGSGRFTKGSTLSPCEFQTSAGSARYNGAWVTLQIQVPTTYSCTLGTVPGCWWKIRYRMSAQANDTTTWAAQIIGDPVHLVEDGT